MNLFKSEAYIFKNFSRLILFIGIGIVMYGFILELYAMVKYWTPVVTEEIKNKYTLTRTLEYKFLTLSKQKVLIFQGVCVFSIGIVLRCLVELAFYPRKSSA